MGQQIASLVSSFEDNAAKEKLANDALNSLMELAKLQITSFQLAISNPNFNAKLIPIGQIISADSIIQANISTQPADIGRVINDVFSAFAKGAVADAVAKLVGSSLNLLIGTYSANTSTVDKYLISTGSLGGVFRIDLHFFAYRYTSVQLREIAKEVLAVSIVISSADLTSVSDNALRVIIQQTYSASSTDEQIEIYNQIKKAREYKQPPTALVSHEFDRATAKLSLLPAMGHPPLEPVGFSQTFEAETPMNQARQHAGMLEAWVRASIADAFGEKAQQISVVCNQDSSSTSNSRIYGHATVTFVKGESHTSLSHDLKNVIDKSLRNACNSALSKVPISSYKVIATASPAAYMGGFCTSVPSMSGGQSFPLSNFAKPTGSGPMRLAIDTSWMWANGSNLRVRLLPGCPEPLRQKIKEHALTWTKYANITFTFVDEGSADIRVAVNQESGSYSYVGKQCLRETDQDIHTMHLDFKGANDEEIAGTTIHEFGHALGCIHEHQGPAADIKWNERAVIDAHARIWTEDMVRRNILNRAVAEHPRFDPESIMMYPIPPGWTEDGFTVGWNRTLSAGDKAVIRKMYPLQDHGASDGVFDTTGGKNFPPLSLVPPPAHPPAHNQKEILFASTCSYLTPPRIAVGISALDVSTVNNIRVSATTSRVTRNSFIIHLDTWGDSTLNSGSATWLEAAEEDMDFLVGSFNTLEVRPMNKPERDASKRIDFDRLFEHVPNIVIWLNSIEFDKDHDVRIKAYATDVDAQGFTVNINTWGQSILYSGGASWIAWKSGRASTYSASVDTQTFSKDKPRLNNGEIVNFPNGIFSKTPRVFLGINRMFFGNKRPIRFKAFASGVTPNEMKWNVNCWGDTLCYGAGVSYLALE